MTIDTKKLLGKWSSTIDGIDLVAEFAEKGELALTVRFGDTTQKIEGTYKLEGKELVLLLLFGDKEQKETITLTKIAENEITGKDMSGKEQTFKRVSTPPK